MNCTKIDRILQRLATLLAISILAMVAIAGITKKMGLKPRPLAEGRADS
ncbi:MAG: hypothetical protein J7647_11615 [Cyanobacteria bacterium SBLK]|nr:hypothetical protein [Cyanobacteria bacterium SBLK]